MTQPTFEEAALHWPRLSAGDQAETAREDDLYLACEEVILSREITTHDDAVLVCQVLLDNLRSGQRSDELDIRAVASLRTWLAGLADDGDLARATRTGLAE
ncbi:hypothetical protein [Brevundimonas sp.]|uniref:hypothetical protein n=1 Tax=Brevundimonas sp. TaxID=1871086 RepID=UPI0025BE6819|nr:hypothetical protein [Brevundimonas sp.]